MMRKIRDFFTTAIVGGMVVVLPIALIAFAFKWLFSLIYAVTESLAKSLHIVEAYPDGAAYITMVLIMVAMFFIGLVVKTRIGKFLYHYLEKYLLSKIPLYSVLSETVSTIADRDQKAFSKVVLVDVYGSGVYMTGFVTDETNPEWYSIFVPTAPNPTNGFVFSTRRDAVIETDLKPEDAVRTVVGMGAGSTEMLSYLSDKKKD